MFKKTALILFCALSLSGCRNADDAAALVRKISAWLGFAQSNANKTLHQQTAPKAADFPLRLPAGWEQIATQNSQSYISPITFTPAKEKTVYYFNSDGKIASTPNIEGYYRELLGTTADGKRVVQDFYQSSQTPQTTPFVLENDAIIESFDSDVNNGRIVWFTRGGDVEEMGDYEKGKPIGATLGIRHGKAVLATEKTDNGTTVYTLDDNTRIASALTERGNTTRAILFYPNGSAMFQGDIPADTGTFATTYCWNEAAQPIACDRIQNEVEAGLQQADSLARSLAHN